MAFMKYYFPLVFLLTFACGNLGITNFVPPIIINEDTEIEPDILTSDMGTQDIADSGVDVDPKSPDMFSEVGPDLAPDIDMGMDIVEDIKPDLPAVDIAIALNALSNVENVEELAPHGGKRRFYVDFRLKLDHFSQNSPVFTQRIILHYQADDAPTVLLTSGYGLFDINRIEQLPLAITNMLQANQVTMGHRFFKGAIPEAHNQNWDFVTIEQSANDTHEILKALQTILKEKWVGTGWSKGGMTILFQEFYFPNDLDLAVPMVAPISFALGDQRYPPFLAQIGTEACRNTLADSMAGAFTRIGELADTFNPPSNRDKEYYKSSIRYSIAAYPWTYWQYFGLRGCNFIPPADAPATDLVNFYLYDSFPGAHPTSTIKPRPIKPEEEAIGAYTYQGLLELGFQDVYAAGSLQYFLVQGYISAQEKNAMENRSYGQGDFPWGRAPAYNPQLMIDVDTFLKTSAEDIIAIYGQHDPWTAGKITLRPSATNQVLIAPGASHAAFIDDLTTNDYNAVRARVLQYDTPNRINAISILPVQQPPTEARRALLIQMLRDHQL